MPNQTLQLFNPLAIHGLAIHLKDFDYRRFTLPHYLSSEDKQRLITLLLGALRAQAPAEGKDANEPIGSLIQLRWEDRAWRNAAQAPAIRFTRGDVLWLVVEKSVSEAELLAFSDDCDCLMLLDLRSPGKGEHVEWLAKLKLALLDAAQNWWRNNVKQAEADKVDFRDSGEWFESPLDALDYCNAIAAGLFVGHSLIYVERQAMAAILAGKAQAVESPLSAEAITALVAFALQERWEKLRFPEPLALPDFTKHFAAWQHAGLGWLVGAEFVPLPALERLRERELLEPFFARWNRDHKEDTAIFLFWDILRLALTPPETQTSLSSSRSIESLFRPLESTVPSGTCGTPKSIRQNIVALFPNFSAEMDDSALQEAMSKEANENHRLLLLAWRVSLWLETAANRDLPATTKLRAENDVARTIDEVWKRLKPTTSSENPTFAAIENWARLRVALADHLTERARLGDASRLNSLAQDHYSISLAVFRSLKIGDCEANVLLKSGALKRRVADLAGARESYETALTIYRQIENRLGEANVLVELGELKLYVADLAGARESHEAALAIYRQIGNRLGEATVLNELGDLKLRVTDLTGARKSYEAALIIYRQIGNRLGEANVLNELGDLKLRVADLAGARESYEAALTIYRQIEARLGEATVLKELGDLKLRVADLAGARESYEAALTIHRQIGDRLGEANVLAGIGKLALADDNQDEADRLLEQAIAIYRAIEDRYSVAAQTGNYGWTLLRRGQKEMARPYLLRAAEVYEDMGWTENAKRYRQAMEEND